MLWITEATIHIWLPKNILARLELMEEPVFKSDHSQRYE